MKRNIWFWLCFIVAIVLATYFATRVVMTGLGYGSAARVHTISISADQGDKDLSAIATAAAVAPGTQTYSVDLDALRARVEAVPGVRAAAVRRLPNGNLIAKVKLYRAVAQWTDGENYFPLSADATIVRRPADGRDENTVLFHGELPADISEITEVAHNLIAYLDYMEWIENRRWNMVTKGGITILLPEENPSAAISSLLVLEKNHNILSKDIRVIDMRDDARILVK